MKVRIVKFQNGKYAVRKGLWDYEYLNKYSFFSTCYIPSEDSDFAVDSLQKAQEALKKYYKRMQAIKDKGVVVSEITIGDQRNIELSK